MRTRWPVLLLMALIAYGSVFPFDYVEHRPALSDLLHLLTDWPRQLSASDVVGNVLLFVPLGLFVPSLAERWPARLGWALGAVVFAWLLQYLQFWYPSRDPSGSDAVFNTLGVALGVALASAAQKVMRSRHIIVGPGSALWPVAAALMLGWLAYRWFPWVPSLDMDSLRFGLRPLVHGISLNAPRVLHDAAAWLLWFWLALQGPIGKLAAGRAAAICSGIIVLAEPLFVGNSVTFSNLLGLAIAIVLRPWLAADTNGQWKLIALLGASLVVSGLAPWRFDAANRFYWLPFAGMLSGSMVLNTASLIEKSYLYAGVVLLLVSAGVRWWLAGLAVAAALGWIESMQVALPRRTAEITDPVLAMLLALAIKAALGGNGVARDPRSETAPKPPVTGNSEPNRPEALVK